MTDVLDRYVALLAEGGGTAAWAGMADALAKELGAVRRDDTTTLTEQRDAVRELHPKRYPAWQGDTTCGTCGTPWPCPTLRAVGATE